MLIDILLQGFWDRKISKMGPQLWYGSNSIFNKCLNENSSSCLYRAYKYKTGIDIFLHKSNRFLIITVVETFLVFWVDLDLNYSFLLFFLQFNSYINYCIFTVILCIYSLFMMDYVYKPHVKTIFQNNFPVI